jgi:hypothetical protein
MTKQRFRYSRVHPRDQPKKSGVYARAANLLAAPLLGSRLFFPRRFDKLFSELLDGMITTALPPAHAHWYFGSRLHLEIDPARLRRRISDYVVGRDGMRWIGTSFLDAADWSRALTPIKASPIHREMMEIVAVDSDFRSTRAYAAFRRAAEIGRPIRRNGIRLTGREEIDAYFRYCLDLISSVKAHGAVRRHFEAPRLLSLKHWRARPPILDRTERDVGIAIDEDGELIRHLGGKHRTAIAQVLRLASIPVEVRLVHVGWLAGQVRDTQLPPHLALREGLQRVAASKPTQAAGVTISQRDGNPTAVIHSGPPVHQDLF